MDSFVNMSDIFPVKKPVDDDTSLIHRPKKKKIKHHDSTFGEDHRLAFHEGVIHSGTEIQLENEETFLNSTTTRLLKIQIEAVRWMRNIENKTNLKIISQGEKEYSGGGLLADDMGLGKTISCLGLIDYSLKFGSDREKVRKTLIVVPLSLINVWENEAIDKMGFLRKEIFVYQGSNRNKELRNILDLENIKIVITNYETLGRESDDGWLFNERWLRVISDESHIARNPKTKHFVSLMKLKRDHMWCVSGTPIVNWNGKYLSSIPQYLRCDHH